MRKISLCIFLFTFYIGLLFADKIPFATVSVPVVFYTDGTYELLREDDNPWLQSEREKTKQPRTEGYQIGDRGPAGGWIFYDCDADNDSGNSDGLISSECGWRYLEAAPGDLAIYMDEIDKPFLLKEGQSTKNCQTKFSFGYYQPSNTGKTSEDSLCKEIGTYTKIGMGKENTIRLVNAMGVSAFNTTVIYDDNWSMAQKLKNGCYAARLCDILTITNKEGIVSDDWFLPSKDELNLMYENLVWEGVGLFSPDSYWSSSEYDKYDDGAYYAWYLYFSSGSQYDSSRYNDYRVRAVRAF